MRTTRRARSRRPWSCATRRVDGRARYPDRHHERPAAKRNLRPRGRRTFVCLGDAVNLAARLMSEAPAADLRDRRVHDAAGAAFIGSGFRDLTQRQVRAGRGLVADGSLGVRRGGIAVRLADVRTDADWRCWGARSTWPLAGTGAVIGIAADPGMGKSRLIAEFVASRAGAGRPRDVWRVPGVRAQYELLRVARDLATLFGLDDDDAGGQLRDSRPTRSDRPRAGRRGRHCSSLCRSSDPGQRPHQLFDAKLRKTSLEGLLATAFARGPHDAARRGARGLPLAR